MEQRHDWGRRGTQGMGATGSMRDTEILWGESESKKKTCDFSLRWRGSLLAQRRAGPAKIGPSFGTVKRRVVLEQRAERPGSSERRAATLADGRI
jgi:hypothetical protein